MPDRTVEVSSIEKTGFCAVGVADCGLVGGVTGVATSGIFVSLCPSFEARLLSLFRLRSQGMLVTLPQLYFELVDKVHARHKNMK